jgi:hypothetical protein
MIENVRKDVLCVQHWDLPIANCILVLFHLHFPHLPIAQMANYGRKEHKHQSWHASPKSWVELDLVEVLLKFASNSSMTTLAPSLEMSRDQSGKTTF